MTDVAEVPTPPVSCECAGRVVIIHTGIELVRQGLVAMLAAIGADTVRTPTCRQELRSEVSGSADATVILGLEDGNCATASEIAAECREQGARVLVLVPGGEEGLLEEVTTIPSDGYLMQQELTTADLRAAVDSMSRQQVYLPNVLAGRLLANARSERGGRRETYSHLTPREREVLVLLVDGLSNKQIARVLRISQHGVKRLVANVLAKLNCTNRTSAVSVALREKLVEPRDEAGEPARSVSTAALRPVGARSAVEARGPLSHGRPGVAVRAVSAASTPPRQHPTVTARVRPTAGSAPR
jgi:two-component system nitrate/nitrite response regulator NarL